jgi:hypothetical protein
VENLTWASCPSACCRPSRCSWRRVGFALATGSTPVGLSAELSLSATGRAVRSRWAPCPSACCRARRRSSRRASFAFAAGSVPDGLSAVLSLSATGDRCARVVENLTHAGPPVAGRVQNGGCFSRRARRARDGDQGRRLAWRRRSSPWRGPRWSRDVPQEEEQEKISCLGRPGAAERRRHWLSSSTLGEET